MLKFEEHRRLGDELRKVSTILSSAENTINFAYTKDSPESAALGAAIEAVRCLRSVLDDAVTNEHRDLPKKERYYCYFKD